MNKAIIILMLSLSAALVFWACTTDEQAPEPGKADVRGTVIDIASGNPLAGVTITAYTTATSPQSTPTDAQGVYKFTFDTDTTKTVTLLFQKSGYRDTSFTVQISPQNVTTANVAMSSRNPISGGGGTGVAATISFVGAAPQVVSVYGVGGDETAYLQWEVRDSVGLPIDAAHAVILAFSIANGPGGGEYLSPLTATTDARGRATHAFNSGIRSGVSQVVASTVVNGRTIASTPVRVVIHAGLPDQTHFTVAPEKHNWPALGIAGSRLPISVLVGDKYTNPVLENTAVYFHTTAGVIQAVTFTNPSGQGTVDLISGNPEPFGQYASQQYGNGYHYVIAQTIGENAVTVKDSTLLLWSGRSLPPGNFSPSSIIVPSLGSQTISFRVADALGHPLAMGTTISVTGSGSPWPVNIYFGNNGSIVLDDVIWPGVGTTDFSFTVADAADTVAYSSVVVNVNVTGPNGNAYSSITGYSH
jgi:hypothetical protein